MAKQYHPLDSRYKGPSTAYTGATKWSAPPATTPTQPAPSGPWDGAVPPALPDSPPPLPRRQARPNKPRRSGLRIAIGLLIVGLIVGGNIYFTRMYSGLVFDVQTQMNTLDL